MTDETLRAEIAALRSSVDSGFADLRTKLEARLADGVEAKVRIEILEETQRALVEARRFMWAQVIAVSGVVAAIVGIFVSLRGHP